MPVGTPTHLIAAGATSTTATSASFTPSANVRLFALCTGRGGTPSKPTFSDSLGGTWTEVAGSSISHGNLWGLLVYQDIGGSPAAMTVTVGSTGATQVGCQVTEISGTGGAISSNFQTGTSDVGDPAVTMSAYASTSMVMAWGIGSAGSAWADPTGFTEIYDLSPATNVRLNTSWDDGATATTSLAWSSTSTSAIGYGLEIPEASAGGATLTADPGSYAITGAAATLRTARLIVAATASYAINGSAATLLKTLPLVASPGSYAILGTAATLLHKQVLAAAGGSYSIVGADAGLNYSPNAGGAANGWQQLLRRRRT